MGITAVAASLPEGRLTTTELQRRVETESGFTLAPDLFSRLTGIRERRIARDDEQASTLAVAAARQLMDDTGLPRDSVDLLLFASGSRDMAEPATAHVVQEQLGTSAHVFDISNACNSLLNGIDTARSFVLAGRARRVLVVTGETPTRAIRWQAEDLSQIRRGFVGYTVGDAGAAVLVEPVDAGGITHISTATFSDHWRAGGIPGGGTRHPHTPEHTYFDGSGREMSQVLELLGPAVMAKMWAETGLSWADFDHVLVHQVTAPYLERIIDRTDVPREKLVVTVPELGNVASASLGVQLARVVGDLRPGGRVFFLGLGAGVSMMMMVWEKS